MKTTFHALIAALTLIGGISVAPDSASAYYSLLGGETLKVRDSAIEAQVGYPELRLGYHIPIIENLEIIPRLNLFYAGLGNYASASAPWPGGNFGMRVGADVKWRFFSKNKFHLAYVGPLGLHLNFAENFYGAVQIPLIGGVAMTWEASDKINVIGGVHLPFSIQFGTGFSGAFVAPFIFQAGAEFALNDQLNLSVLVEAGPVVTRLSGFTSVTSFVSGLFGVQYRL